MRIEVHRNSHCSIHGYECQGRRPDNWVVQTNHNLKHLLQRFGFSVSIYCLCRMSRLQITKRCQKSAARRLDIKLCYRYVTKGKYTRNVVMFSYSGVITTYKLKWCNSEILNSIELHFCAEHFASFSSATDLRYSKAITNPIRKLYAN